MRELLKKRWFRIILVLEAAILGYLVIKSFKPLSEYVMPYSAFEYVNGIVSEENGIYTNKEIYEEDDTYKGFFIYGPAFNIDRGIYKLTIDYRCDEDDNYIGLSCYNSNYNSLLMDDCKLNSRFESKEVTLWSDKSIRGLSISVYYGGKGELLVENISLKETVTGRIYAFVSALIAVIFINLTIWIVYMGINGLFDRKKLFNFLVLGTIVVFASFPLFTSFLTEGHDLSFHLLRIEGIKDGLLSGQFPVRIHPTQFNGYGYASPIFYGEILLYIPALLRLCGFPLQLAYKIFVIIVNIATTMLAYECFKRLFKSERIGLICSFVYVLAPYRISNIYVRSSVGEYCAMIFWPLIAYALYLLIFGDYKNTGYRKIWILLTFGYTGLIQTHLLSCEIAAVVSVIVCIICIKRIFRKETIRELIKFFTATVLINAFFLVPLVNYMSIGGLIITDYGSVTTHSIQENGIYPAQLFNLFIKGSGMAYGHGVEAYKKLGMNGEMGISVGLTLILGMIIFIYLFLTEYRKLGRNRYFRIAEVMSVGAFLAMYMSTCIFPWDPFCRNWGSIVYNIQFPWRLLGIAGVFLTIIAGCVLVAGRKIFTSEIYHAICIAMIAINVITTGYMQYDCLANTAPVYVYDGTSLLSKGTGSLDEYVPSGMHFDKNTTYEPSSSGNVTFTDYVKKYTNISFNATETQNLDGVVLVPLNAYKGYVAADKDGNKLELYSDEDGRFGIIIPAGYSGAVNLSYRGLWYWRISDIISLISVIIFLIYVIKKRKINVDIVLD